MSNYSKGIEEILSTHLLLLYRSSFSLNFCTLSFTKKNSVSSLQRLSFLSLLQDSFSRDTNSWIWDDL